MYCRISVNLFGWDSFTWPYFCAWICIYFAKVCMSHRKGDKQSMQSKKWYSDKKARRREYKGYTYDKPKPKKLSKWNKHHGVHALMGPEYSQQVQGGKHLIRRIIKLQQWSREWSICYGPNFLPDQWGVNGDRQGLCCSNDPKRHQTVCQSGHQSTS